MDFSAIKALIQQNIRTNNNEDITGNVLQQVLLGMIETLGDDAINDILANVDNIEDIIQDILNGGYGDCGVYDISDNHGGASYASLSAALGTNGTNVPEGLRKGGMSVKFVNSSDNKYVQYRLMSTSFSTNPNNWQNVDVDSNIVELEDIDFSNRPSNNEQLDSEGKIQTVSYNNRRITNPVIAEPCVISVTGGTDRPTIFFYNDSINLNTGEGFITGITLDRNVVEDLYITPPTGATKMVISYVVQSSTIYKGLTKFKKAEKKSNNDLYQLIHSNSETILNHTEQLNVINPLLNNTRQNVNALESIVTEISDISLSSNITGSYYNASGTVATIVEGEGIRYEGIDLSSYIGKKVKLELNNASSISGRFSFLGNESMRVYRDYSFTESSFVNGGITFIPSSNYHILYISFSSSASIAYLKAMNEKVVLIEEQTLTEVQKEQVRENIGINEIIEGLGVDNNFITLSELKYSSIYEIPGTRGKQFNSSGALVESGNNNRRICEVDVKPFIIDISNGADRPSICFYNDNMNLDTGAGLIDKITLATTYTYGLKVDPPAGTTHVIVSCISQPPSYFGWIIHDYTVMDNNDIMHYIFNAASCYVSPTGSDENEGTESSPFATFQHAIDSGYKKIFGIDGNYGCQKISISDKKDISIICVPSGTRTSYINGDTRKGRIILDNSVDVVGIELDSSTNLYKFTKTFDTTSNWHKVFITQELPIIRPNLRSESYWAILWEIGQKVDEHKKLVPVLSISDCQATSGTFYYDGTSVYVHPYNSDITNTTFKYLHDESDFNFIKITNTNDFYIEGVDIYFGTDVLLSSTNCFGNNIIRNCDFGFGAYQTHEAPNTTNENVYNCNSFCACADGFAPTVAGTANYYNCYGGYNGDDGISHHDNCIGVVDGGIWEHNGKGGVSPAHHSNVNVMNVYSAYNNYGLYLQSDPGHECNAKSLIKNCTFVNNTNKDIRVYHYNAIITGCIYSTKEFMGAGWTVEEIGNTVLNS